MHSKFLKHFILLHKFIFMMQYGYLKKDLYTYTYFCISYLSFFIFFFICLFSVGREEVFIYKVFYTCMVEYIYYHIIPTSSIHTASFIPHNTFYYKPKAMSMYGYIHTQCHLFVLIFSYFERQGWNLNFFVDLWKKVKSIIYFGGFFWVL